MAKHLRRMVDRYSKGIVLLCIIVTFVFTHEVLFLAYIGVEVPSLLIACVFGMYGVELASCAVIKRGEDKYEALKANAEGQAMPQVEFEEEDDDRQAD